MALQMLNFDTMETIAALFNTYKQQLSDLYPAREAEAIASLVLTELTGANKATIKAFPERELTLTQQEAANAILTQLKTGKPLQYVIGYTDFYGLRFMVNPATLIPRPETEELVEWVLEEYFLAGGNDRILDIGTGSGCIAISIKNKLPLTEVYAIDISPEALNTAKQNAELNEVEVNFIEQDILTSRSDIEHPKFEIIISNPPYVTLEDKKRMHTNVTDFEPHTALFVPEDDPLIFYKAIADFALASLTPNGLLFFEINESLGQETVELLQGKGFVDVELRQDMSGRDRMIKAVKA